MANKNQDTPPLFRMIKYFIIFLVLFLAANYFYHSSSLFYRKSIAMPLSLHLNTNDLYMIKGEEFHLYVFDINKRVSFSSTNFRVAGVNFNGRIFAYQVGKAFILVKVGKKELRCRVHVIDINTKNLVISQGDTYRLKIRGTNSFVSWKSMNKKVASVSFFGTVKAKSKGTTVIYAKVKGKTLRTEIKVR